MIRDTPLSDEDGFRTDVLEALLRYPGGNFVSGYHWEDGVGPAENRPKVFNYAWLAEETNRFGTVEFIKLCRKVGAEPYLCVNMGSGTAEEAMNWVEFCNGTGDTRYAALRKRLGYEEPFRVKYWGLRPRHRERMELSCRKKTAAPHPASGHSSLLRRLWCFQRREL